MKFCGKAHAHHKCRWIYCGTYFPYRNIIVVNPTEEPIKIDVPIFSEEWIKVHRKLGLEITLVENDDSFLRAFRKAKIKLDKMKENH